MYLNAEGDANNVVDNIDCNFLCYDRIDLRA